MNNSRERKGFNPQLEEAHQKDTDWIFGASSPTCIALIPMHDRERYFPRGEVQRGRDDFMDCATRGPDEDLEAKFTWLYQNGLLDPADREWFDVKRYTVVREDIGHTVEFSDRFNAILSGTTAVGNSMIAPIDSIHSHGLIPKSMLPSRPDMTLEEYLDPKAVTPQMRELGMQFLSRFSIYYERVLLKDFPAAIEQDMLVVAGYAWPKPKDGIYPKTDNDPNHVFVYFKTPKYHVRDSYLDDGQPDDFVKRLAHNYNLMDYGYRLFIRKNDVSAPRSFVDQLVSALFYGRLAELWRLITKGA